MKKMADKNDIKKVINNQNEGSIILRKKN